jgi:hypothetical protein
VRGEKVVSGLCEEEQELLRWRHSGATAFVVGVLRQAGRAAGSRILGPGDAILHLGSDLGPGKALRDAKVLAL